MIQRLMTVDASTIVELMTNNAQIFVADGHKVAITSSRLRTYTKGVKCVHCGLEGQYFAVEKTSYASRRWHLNLYHRKTYGAEIMMTSDHIIAKANGGGNYVDNRQPMCADCNTLKSDYNSIDEAIAAKKLRDAAKNDIVHINTKIENCLVTVAYCERMIDERDRTRKWNCILKAAEKTIMRYINHYEQMKRQTA